MKAYMHNISRCSGSASALLFVSNFGPSPLLLWALVCILMTFPLRALPQVSMVEGGRDQVGALQAVPRTGKLPFVTEFRQSFAMYTGSTPARVLGGDALSCKRSGEWEGARRRDFVSDSVPRHAVLYPHSQTSADAVSGLHASRSGG